MSVHLTYSLSSPPSPSFSTSVCSNSSSCCEQTRSRQLTWRMRTLALASYWPEWVAVFRRKIKRTRTYSIWICTDVKRVAIYLEQDSHHLWQKMTPDPTNQKKPNLYQKHIKLSFHSKCCPCLYILTFFLYNYLNLAFQSKFHIVVTFFPFMPNVQDIIILY